LSYRKLTKKEINGFITNLCNGCNVSNKQRKFLERGFRINLEQKQYFCIEDFSELKPTTFRQYIYKLRKFIITGIKSNPCFYRIKGTPELSSGRPVTDRPMGDKMIQILGHVREQPASIHDIKIQTFSENLHDILLKHGMKSDSFNKGIFLPKLRFDVNTYSKIQIYRSTVTIDIACTHQPLVYDIAGVTQLTSILGQIYYHLQLLSKSKAHVPSVGEWIVKMYHAGKDGTQSFSGDSYEIRYDELVDGTIRYYNKLWGDGIRRPRFERVITPNVTLIEEIDRIMIDEYLSNR